MEAPICEREDGMRSFTVSDNVTRIVIANEIEKQPC